MTTYGEVVDDLARAVARLAAERAATDSLPVTEAVLAARQAVFDGLRHTTDALTGQGDAPDRPRLADLELDPAGAFRSALHHHPRARTDVVLSDAIADERLPKAWGTAAAAALSMARYGDALITLSSDARWTAIGELAGIVGSLTHIDDDLSKRAPTGTLADRQPRASLRLAANAVRAEAQRRGPDTQARIVEDLVPARQWPIHRAADIPIAMGRLAAMTHARGADLTMHEVGCTLQSIASGLRDAAGVLRITAWRSDHPDQLLALAAHSERASEAIASVARSRGQVMTIGPVDRELVGQAAELRAAMRSLLNYSGTAEGADNLGPARVSAIAIANTVVVTVAAERAIAAAGGAGQLLVHDRLPGQGAFRWRQAVEGDPRVVQLLARVHDASGVARVDRDGRRIVDLLLAAPNPTAPPRRSAGVTMAPAQRLRERTPELGT